MLHNLCLQFSFQAVLSTNGTSSYVAFTYADPEEASMVLPQSIGFNAGDRERFSTAAASAVHLVFRVDGMLLP